MHSVNTTGGHPALGHWSGNMEPPPSRMIGSLALHSLLGDSSPGTQFHPEGCLMAGWRWNVTDIREVPRWLHVGDPDCPVARPRAEHRASLPPLGTGPGPADQRAARPGPTCRAAPRSGEGARIRRRARAQQWAQHQSSPTSSLGAKEWKVNVGEPGRRWSEEAQRLHLQAKTPSVPSRILSTERSAPNSHEMLSIPCWGAGRGSNPAGGGGVALQVIFLRKTLARS